MKKVIAIDIDEVLRAKRLQFDRYYAQEFGEENIKYPINTFDLKNHFPFNEKKETINYLNDELPEDISPTEYMLDAEGKAAVDHMAFRKVEETLTPEENYNKFTYEDFILELFAYAPVLYRDVDLHLREFVSTFDEYAEFALFSKEQNPSISPTLFFLSKIRPTIRTVYFTKTSNEIWEKNVDIVITTDPEILAAAPSDKITVKLDREWNEESLCYHRSINLIDLVKDNDFRQRLGAPNYVEPVEPITE